MGDDERRFQLSRRKLLGSAAAVGAGGAFGGAATNALFHDEEVFGSATNPNVLEGGTLNLKVDWEAQYFRDGVPLDEREFVDETSEDEDGVNEDGEVEQPGPLVRLTDVKPGDVLELTLSSHVYGNPAFLGMHYEELADEEGNVDDGGNSTSEPERDAHEQHDGDGKLDDEGGELDEYVQVIVWHDDDDNAPGEVWEAADDGAGGLVLDEIQNTGDAAAAATDAEHSLEDNDQLIYAGSLADVPDEGMLDSGNAESGQPSGTFPGTGCYQNSITEYVGVLAWLPRDIPGVNNNVVQGDRVDFQFGFHAEQCRHNTTETETPVECSDCSFETSGASTSPEVTVQSTDASSFPQISTFLGIDTSAGNAGDLTTSEFSCCEDNCQQSVSSDFTASGKKVDIVFLFDVSGSMSPQIDSVKDNIDSLVTDLENEGIDAQYALEAFSDDGDDGGSDPDGVERASDLTDATDFQNNVLPPLTTGYGGTGNGGDFEEDAWDSIVDVHGTFSSADSEGPLSWRAGSERILILITDAEAETETDDGGIDATRASALSALRDGNYLYFAVTNQFGTSEDPASLVDETGVRGQKIALGSDFGPIFTTITDEISGATYRLDYTTTNPATDGDVRDIVIRIDDPDEGTLEAVTDYTAPS